MKNRLRLKTKIGYGIGDLPGNLFFTMIGFYLLNYLTDTVLISPALAGTAIMIGRIWDAITDPAVGYISDHSSCRLGRRRPFMFFGAIILGLTMATLFSPPPTDNGLTTFWYIVIIYCLVNTAYTLHSIPYGAWAPEITQDYDERTTLNGFRNVFAVTGTLLGAGLILPLISYFGGGISGWQSMGISAGIFMAVTGVIPSLMVPEQPANNSNKPKAGLIPMLKDYAGALKNRAYLLILIPWCLNLAGINIIQASLIYYFTYIYRNSGAFALALAGMLIVCMISIPVWVFISKKIGKKWSYMLGMGLFAIMIMLFFLAAPHFDERFAFIIMALAGIGFGTQYVMPFSIVADVTDQDYSISGVRREGVFFGMFTFWSKIGQAIGIWLVGWILELSGFIRPAIAGQIPEQNATTLNSIRMLIGPIPVLFFVSGILILYFYPITKTRFTEIIKKISSMEASNRQGENS
ncbi:MAG: MFS transporter [Spirochaetaceae bacterium]|nr:MAG: MFS transporter [Spirochaetaceae bacterium]